MNSKNKELRNMIGNIVGNYYLYPIILKLSNNKQHMRPCVVKLTSHSSILGMFSHTAINLIGNNIHHLSA